MKLFKLTVSACALAAAVSFTACDDSSSASDEGKVSYDCSVKDGVKVAYPKGGESFKIGDTITVVYGADVEDSGYRILLKTDEDDAGMDMLDESLDPAHLDGKTCNEQKVVLKMDFLPDSVELPLLKALIRVSPYNKTAKGANSGSFKLAE